MANRPPQSKQGGRRKRRPPKQRPKITLTTEARLAAGGDALARTDDGRIVFVSNAAPNESVEAEIVQDNERFMRARAVGIVEASKDRVDAPCRHFERCGGCSLQFIAEEAQSNLLFEASRENFARLGLELSPDAEDEPFRAPAYGERMRARMLIHNDGSFGYRAARSHKLVKINECPVLAPALQLVLPRLKEMFRSKPPEVQTELLLLTNGDEVQVATNPPGPWDSTWIEGVVKEDIKIVGVRHSARGFAQAGLVGNAELVQTVKDYTSDAKDALEFYAGSGNLTCALPTDIEVTAVESDIAARRRLEENRQVNIVEGSAEEAVETLSGRFDLILADPPRAGLTPSVLNYIAANTRRFVYVSCDGATFARDAKKFVGAGFKIERWRMLHLLPQTGHMETVARFVR